MNTLSVTSKSGGLKASFRVQTPDACRQVLGGSKEEARVARPLNALYCVVMTGIFSVLHEGGELEGAILGIGGCGRRSPSFNLATKSDGEMLTGRREDKRGDGTFEGEVVERYATVEVCKNSLAVFVDCEEEIALGVQGKAGDVTAMSEGEGMRLVATTEGQYDCMRLQLEEEGALDEVKDSDAIADGRQQACAIRAEAEVSSPVDRAEQVGELDVVSARGSFQITREESSKEDTP